MESPWMSWNLQIQILVTMQYKCHNLGKEFNGLRCYSRIGRSEAQTLLFARLTLGSQFGYEVPGDSGQ